MRSYKIKYWDALGGGTTIIESLEPMGVEEAVQLIREQLLYNDIEATPIQVEVFEEITNPIGLLITNFQRLAILPRLKRWII